MYPELDDLDALTEGLDINVDLCKKEIESTLEPFKDFEMEQLYSNIQIQQAEIFESEFISKEMNENLKLVGDHLLYSLLRKYARSRVQLKINQ